MGRTLSRLFLLTSAFLLSATFIETNAGAAAYDRSPPFSFRLLPQAALKTSGHTGGAKTYSPRTSYAIFINYELGMHCVGFNVSYCCIIPPYNSIQAQAVRTADGGKVPKLLTGEDGIRLRYSLRGNSYSEGNKMRYWRVLKDVNGNGTLNDPGDAMPNYVWNHLFIYRGLQGALPKKPKAANRRYLGKDLPLAVDSGPTGKSLVGGKLDYAGPKGGDIVFTDTLLPTLQNVPLTLTASYLWDALGLPLTAFYDSRREGSIRTVTDRDFQPYQYARVSLQDRGGKTVAFFGTEPVDISDCSFCHSGQGPAARKSRQEGITLFDREDAYWKKNYPDESEYMARLSATMIDILELHDRHFKTNFLRDYNAGAPTNRLGYVGAVNCPDCHGDNMSGNLQTPRPGATGYPLVKAKPLSEAVHALHLRLVPMPDKAGRPQSCQACHPNHWQPQKMNDFATNPYVILDHAGNPRFSERDLRTAGGGCFLRRDAHSNPQVKPPFFLNAIGQWYLREVSRKDAEGKAVKSLRGLYCTNCHNRLAHALYRSDALTDGTGQTGRTLRNRSLEEVIQRIAGGDRERFRNVFTDPKAGAAGDPLETYWSDHQAAPLLKMTKAKNGGETSRLAWNAKRGESVSYVQAFGGSDWWFSPGEPHCADCHLAPFVESTGGHYFPIDQPGKYALYRYSKAHGALACQSCHQSMHGLYPVRFEGEKQTVDLTSHQQALQFSPDGTYAGPVTCAACHTVNEKGVPVQLVGTKYAEDYWASVVLIHFMREGDRRLSIGELVDKYPYVNSRGIVSAGWD